MKQLPPRERIHFPTKLRAAGPTCPPGLSRKESPRYKSAKGTSLHLRDPSSLCRPCMKRASLRRPSYGWPNGTTCKFFAAFYLTRSGLQKVHRELRSKFPSPFHKGSQFQESAFSKRGIPISSQVRYLRLSGHPTGINIFCKTLPTALLPASWVCYPPPWFEETSMVRGCPAARSATLKGGPRRKPDVQLCPLSSTPL